MKLAFLALVGGFILGSAVQNHWTSQDCQEKISILFQKPKKEM